MTNSTIDCPVFTNPSSPPLETNESYSTSNPLATIPIDLSNQVLQIPNSPIKRDEINQSVLALSYSGLLVRGLIAVALLTMVRSCANIACQHTARLGFVASSSKPNDLEADRIRAAIDLLRTLEDDDLWSLSGQAYYTLSQPQFYNPEIFGGVEVAPGSDTTFGGAAIGTFKIIVNDSFITGDHWDKWGLEGLALILFAEWQHLHQPSWTEEQCQEQLEIWRERVGFENVAPEFTHGMSDTHDK